MTHRNFRVPRKISVASFSTELVKEENDEGDLLFIYRTAFAGQTIDSEVRLEKQMIDSLKSEEGFRMFIGIVNALVRHDIEEILRMGIEAKRAALANEEEAVA